MYGTYEIVEGEYLFTYSYRDLVKFNKPFIVKQGGTIVWDGDPYSAQIDLEAEYFGLRTSIYNLIAEFFTSSLDSELESAARNATTVDLSMLLKGDLFSPEISFDLEFPELIGRLKGFVDTKMFNLSKDENEMNRQVFGLMVIGGFLPSNQADIGSEVVNFGVNTISQFLSNQLSLYVSELLSDILAENGVFTRAELNVNYSVYNNQDIDINQQINNTRASALSLQLKNYLFKERLAIKIGTDIGIGDETAIDAGSVSAINAFDVIVEWVITKDRRFKLVVYNRNENNFLGPARKSGFGISYRYEFDTLDEFFKGFRKKTREIVDANK